MKKTIAATVAVIALAAAVPLVASAGADRQGGPGEGRHGMMMGQGGMGDHGRMGHRGGRGPGGKLRMLDLIETYDADGDGSVTQAEVDQHRADRLGEFDADGNGQLSLDEYQALWLDAMRARMVDQFQRHDDDGDGQVTVEEFGERSARMVMMRDRNEDGALNQDDLRRPRGERGERGRMGGGMPGATGTQEPAAADPAAPAQPAQQ